MSISRRLRRRMQGFSQRRKGVQVSRKATKTAKKIQISCEEPKILLYLCFKKEYGSSNCNT